ncbi:MULTISPECIES: HNH endonuclease [unclassified Streptomyces]|uniref:HNH endonuclease n=1 Tax=unclassified Streptomyces TaxID=2593676 RepID=UPI0036EE5D37
MSLVTDLVEHYQQLIERGELKPEDVPSPRQMGYEWCVSTGTAQEVRTALMRGGMAVHLTAPKPLGEITDQVMWDRFWPRVDAPDENGCTKWNWRTDSSGYGWFWLNGRMPKAHIVAYTYLLGPITPGNVVDHVYEAGCRSRLCVNIEHLEQVTTAENNRRMYAAGRRKGSIWVRTELDEETTDVAE